MKNIFIIFNSQVNPNSMGGGDKIVLGISKYLITKKINLKFLGCPDGEGMMNKSLKNIEFIRINNYRVKNFRNFAKTYIFRILLSFNILKKINDPKCVIWSSSDFLPDSFPGFLYKLFHPKAKWLMSMFLRARNPFTKEVKFDINSVLFFFSQDISLLLFKFVGDKMFVLSKSDIKYLQEKAIAKSKIIKINAGIDIEEIDKVKTPIVKKYDACFVGRFHEQKGLPELIYIWSEIAKKQPRAKFAIVGWGEKEETIKLKKLIKQYKLQQNISMFGFLDGKEKFKVIKSSKVFCFTSTFESWGVVIAEALACGTPVIAFELNEIKDNFKDSVLWVKNFDNDAYVEDLFELLINEKKRSELIAKSTAIIQNFDYERVGESIFKNVADNF